ncbi:hypothetical protein D3C80_1464420 [compost metagenome]
MLYIGLIQTLKLQLTDPFLEVGRPHGNLCQRPIGLWCRVPIDAFIGLMIAAPFVGKFIDFIHDTNGRADVWRVVEAEGGFTKTPVSSRLVVG